MKTVLKLRWLILIIWLAAVAGLVLSAPNMGSLVRDKGQITVPDGYSSTNAGRLLDEMNASAGQDGSSQNKDSSSAILVFHKPDGLTPEDLQEVERGVETLKNGEKAYGIVSVTDYFDTPELEKQLVSEDGKTVLAVVGVSLDGRTPAEARDALYEALADNKVEHYYTGGWLINEDVVESSQEGLKKTEYITVAFILVILFVVFRAVIAPFIPLLTVGISYIAAQSVVAFLVDSFDFPLSNFTQIFMVAVMFGIGTDYCILLISRFKEELAHRGDKTEAILATYRTAGRTVMFAGLAVLVGFAAIGFSTFSLYRSAVAVAVGVAVLLLALATLVPFFMAVLGKTIFWPVRGSIEHKESRLWGAVGSFSLKRPLIALLILAAVVVPFLSAYKGSISFNSLDEIGNKYDSVKAFEVISDSFGPGESLPATVVLKADKALDTSEGLASLEQVARELAAVDGVKAVRGATRPTGEALADFQVAQQAGSVGDGLGQGGEGLAEIGKGLSDASSALSGNAPKLQQAATGAGQLTEGTEALKSGVGQLAAGLKRIEQGLRDGTAGAGELQAGLVKARDSAKQLAGASRKLLGSYREIGTGLGSLSEEYGRIAQKQADLAQGLSDLGQGLGGLGEKYPELKDDPDFLKAQASVTRLQTGTAQLSEGLKQLNGTLSGVAEGVNRANAGLDQAEAGQTALADGLDSLASGIARLEAGIKQAADGQSAIVGKVPEMEQGLDRLNAGQKELQAGFEQLNGQLTELTGGLNRSVDGLSQVTGGLESAQGYLNELSGTPNKQMTGWFIPEDAIRNADFQQALDAYMSDDRKIAKFDVVFEDNPYGSETLGKADELQAAADRALKASGLGQAESAVGGVTSANNDLHQISGADYSKTVVLMLIGVAAILILLYRSLVIPLYLIVSLLLTYYTSLAIAEAIFVRLLGISGLSWTVPFFAFVLLIALGVDYSIFLMDRFKEYRHLPPQEGILKAMRNMGTVIMSAAVILGGTFAAMLPSGVMSLLQIATIVLCGLFLYALLILPLFVPVMVKLFGRANWWPMMKESKAETEPRSAAALDA